VPPVMSDEQLLTSGEPEAFGVFYARYRIPIERYFAARLDDRETAADLAADTFASALLARCRFVPGATPPRAGCTRSPRAGSWTTADGRRSTGAGMNP
jgi:DNA-directed RNA polymerase specialized sigma24 family protein